MRTLYLFQNVFVRNGIYYYRADIPTDLKYHFHSSEIKQSLKTKDSKLAKVMTVNLEHQVQKAFMMLRTGMLPDDVAIQVIQQFVPSGSLETLCLWGVPHVFHGNKYQAMS